MRTTAQDRGADGGRMGYRMAAVVLVALAAGLGMVLVGFDAQRLVDRKFDPYFFGEMGKSLARGEGFLPYGILIKRRAPLYPLVIGGIYWLFGERPLLVLLLQVALHAATCALVVDLGRRLFNARTGLVAGLLCALHPLLLRYVADLHLEALLTFLFTSLVWATVRFHESPGVGRGAAVGAVAALASLTKAVAVLYPALFVGAWVVLRRLRGGAGAPGRLPWKSVAAMALTMGALIAPWTFRNWQATGGRFVLISSGASDAFLRGYVFTKADYALLRKPPYEHAENEVNAWFARICREAGAVWEQDDWQTEQILKAAAKRKLLDEPGELVRKFAVGLFAFWYEMTSLANSLLVGGLALGAWALAIVGWRRARREGRPAWLLLLPVLYLNLFLAALLALGRYSAPILPALLVLTAYGVDALLDRRGAAHG